MAKSPARTTAQQQDEQFERLAAQLSAVGTPTSRMIDLMEKLGRVTSAQADALRDLNAEAEHAKWADNVKKQFKDIGFALARGDLFGAFGRLGSAIGSIGGPIGKVAAAAIGAPAALINLGKQIDSLVAKANPAASFQFNRALDDLMATFGQILTPILNGLTTVVRAFADVMQGLKPAFMVITEAIGDFFKFIGKIVSELADLMGSKGKSVGAAVRPASYGSIDEIGKRTTLNVLNQGRGGLTPDGENTGKKLEKSNELLAKILEKVGVGKESAGDAAKWIDRGMMTNPVTNIVRLIAHQFK